MKKVILLIVLAFSLSTNAQEKELSKTDEVLSKAVEKGIELTEKTGNFVIEQAPDLLKEFYQWRIISCIMWIVIAIILFLSGRYFPYLWMKDKIKEAENNEGVFFNRRTSGYMDDGNIPAWITFVALSVTAAAIIISNVYELIYISVAPKLYLIEYFIK